MGGDEGWVVGMHYMCACALVSGIQQRARGIESSQRMSQRCTHLDETQQTQHAKEAECLGVYVIAEHAA